MIKVISEVEEIRVTLRLPDRLMETAVTRALMFACSKFGIDEYGNSEIVEEWLRSQCSVKIEFEGMKISSGMGGQTYTVIFKAWCEKYSEEDDD